MNQERQEPLIKILYRDECYAIQGAVHDVYREMGCGFLEAVYQECLEKEFTLRNIPFKAKTDLRLTYKGDALVKTYEADFICIERIVI
jgi:GxxExxY protein